MKTTTSLLPLVALSMLVVACGGDDPMDPSPLPAVDGYWDVDVETVVNTCSGGDPGFSWVERVRLERQGAYLGRQVWNADIGCPAPDDWVMVPMRHFMGNTFSMQGEDSFSPGPGCTARVTWSHTVTFSDNAFEGRFIEEFAYEGVDCFGNFDCRVEDVETGTRCVDCWPCD